MLITPHVKYSSSSFSENFSMNFTRDFSRSSTGNPPGSSSGDSLLSLCSSSTWSSISCYTGSSFSCFIDIDMMELFVGVLPVNLGETLSRFSGVAMKLRVELEISPKIAPWSPPGELNRELLEVSGNTHRSSTGNSSGGFSVVLRFSSAISTHIWMDICLRVSLKIVQRFTNSIPRKFVEICFWQPGNCLIAPLSIKYDEGWFNISLLAQNSRFLYILTQFVV